MSQSQDLTRRDFFAHSAAIGAGALLTIGAPGFAQAERTLPKVKFGKTGLDVTTLGFGSAFNITPPLLNAALVEGINFIDTAQSYNRGNSEINIGSILQTGNKRKDCIIVTKCGSTDTSELVSKLPGSLERLQTDYVDIYYIHNLGNPGRLDDELKATAEKLKKEKKIRFFGFSSHHRNMVETMEKAAEVGFVDAIMFKYNFRDYDNDALNRAIDKCAKANIGLVAMKTQGGAESFGERVDAFSEKGFNKYQAVLKAVWADDRIHCAVSAMQNIQQVRDNTTAARESKLGVIERELLEQYAQQTRHLNCRGCGNICESCTGSPVNIADTLRYRMYYENYGEREKARQMFAELPAAARNLAGVDFSAAEKACPYHLPIGKLMTEAMHMLS